MIYRLSEEELKKARTIEESYAKLINESGKRIIELRPDGYDKKGLPNVTPENFEKWLAAGSDKWREERKRRLELVQESNETIKAYFESVYDAHFKKIADDPEAIIKDAQDEIRQTIFNRYNYYDQARNNGDFSAQDVRLQEDGNFKLDVVETRFIIIDALKRHIKALPSDLAEGLYELIDCTLSTNPLVSDTGKLGALIKKRETTEGKTAETGLTVNRPKNYKYPNTKVSTRLFGNELTTEKRNYFTPLSLNSKKTVFTYANFVMPSTAVSAPNLDDYDDRVYAGIGSCIFAGNNFIPFSTLYNRGMLGLSSREKNRAVTEDIRKDILETLEKFLGQVTIDNDPTGEREKADPNFKREIIRESLLFYQIRKEIVHGQVTEGIAIPSGYIPVLYRYAENNRNEIITDRIESIHVAGLNYTRQNITIASATYKRVKEIQYHNEQKGYKREIPENKRTIRYDSIAEKANYNLSSMTPTERNRFKKKIDSCMKSYQESGLFDHYEHKRDDTKTFYAVVLYFEPEPLKLK